MTAPVGILLAAGNASRFGAPKLLHPMPDGVAVGVAAACAMREVMQDTIAVVWPGDRALVDAFTQIGLQVVENPRAEEGMASSLVAGINASADAGGWLIALADMPWTQPATVAALAERLNQGASMVAPVHQGRRGHPVGFSACWREALQELRGDRGARDLMANHPHELELLPTGDVGVLLDVDHPSDLYR